jgi:predicted transcriptional regulator
MNKVFMVAVKKPLSFTELLEATKLSRASLALHLKSLEDMNVIFKDTIKPYEAGVAQKDAGKVVYRVVPSNYEDYFRQIIRDSLGFLGFNFSDKRNEARLKAEIDRFIGCVSEIVLDDAEVLKKKLTSEST